MGCRATACWQCAKRQLGLTQVQEHLAQIALGRGDRGVDLDGPAQVVASGLLVVQGAAGGAQVGVDHRVALGKGERGPEGAGGFGVAAQAVQSQSQIVVDGGFVQAEIERGTAALERALDPAQRAIGFGQGGVQKGEIGPQLDGLLEPVDGRPGPPLRSRTRPSKCSASTRPGLRASTCSYKRAARSRSPARCRLSASVNSSAEVVSILRQG